MKKILSLVLVIAMASLMIAACGGDDSPILVAVTAPLSGTNARYGESIVNGATMAMDAVNANGGINGRQVEIVARDDRSDPNEGVSIANEIVANQNILAVLGNFNSSVTLAASPIYNNTGIVQVSPGSSSPLVSVCLLPYR